MTPRSAAEKLFYLIFIFSLVFYSYRYPLRYNSASTSPTYHATPFFWEIVKYLIVLLLCIALYIALVLRGRPLIRMKRRTATVWIAVTGLTCLFLVKFTMFAMFSHDVASLGNLSRILFFMPAVILFPFLYTGPGVLRNLFKISAVILAYQIIYSSIELFLYFAYGRLPALAYAGSLARFGGAWDDPNGFGMYLVFCATGVVALRQRMRKFVFMFLLLSIVALLVATFSYSSYIAMVASLVSYLLMTRQLKRGLAFLLVGGISLFVVWMVVPQLNSLAATIDQISRWKYASLEGHLSSSNLSDVISSSSPVALLVGRMEHSVFNENFYLLILENTGILGLVWLFMIISMSVARGLKLVRRAIKRSDRFEARMLAGATSFVVAFAVACVGIPYFAVYPVNFLFWLTVLILAVVSPGDIESFSQIRRFSHD